MLSIPAAVRRHARAARRHRWKALALAWAVCLAGWAGVSALPDRYQSSARVYADADAVLGAALRGIAIDSSPAGQVELLQRTLLSQPNLERVIARTDLDQRVDSVAAREELLKDLAKDIRIAAQTKNLFTITYADRDARLARDVVQTVLNLFIDSATSTDRQQMENARAFVGQQIASYEGQLREAEQRRADFRARYIDLLPSDTLGGVSRLEQARVRLHQQQGELQDARLTRDLLRQQEASPAAAAAAAAPLATGGGGGGGLAEAERTLRELRLRYTEQHPDVAAARARVADLRNAGGGGGPRGPAVPRGAGRAGPADEQFRLRLLEADARVASLERQVKDDHAEVERLEALARGAPQLQAQSINLDRDYNVLRKSYEELLARRESLQIAGAARAGADRVRLEVVDPPTMPSVPAGPHRLLLAAGVLVVGLGAGAALALLLVQLDRGFYTPQDLRRLGLPVLGGISAADPAAPRGRAAMAAAAFGGGLALLLAVFVGVVARGHAVAAKLPELLTRIGA